MRSRGAFAAACLAPLLLAGCYNLRPSDGGGQTEFDGTRTVRAEDVAVPDGYRIEAVATGLTFPTGVAVDDAGVPHVVEAGYSYGEVFTVPRLLRAGTDGSLTEVARRGRNGPWTGVAFAHGAFFVAEGGQLEGGRILRIARDGAITALVSGLPGKGDHHTNGPAIGPDGMIYFGQGVATNSGVVGVDNAQFGWLERFPAFHDMPCADVKLAGQNFASPNPLKSADGSAVGQRHRVLDVAGVRPRRRSLHRRVRRPGANDREGAAPRRLPRRARRRRYRPGRELRGQSRQTQRTREQVRRRRTRAPGRSRVQCGRECAVRRGFRRPAAGHRQVAAAAGDRGALAHHAGVAKCNATAFPACGCAVRPSSRSSLIPREELLETQPLTIADALLTVPGVHVDRIGGPGGISNTYLRGADPNHTLVLIDGVPINDPNDVHGGSVDLTTVTAHDVERIEVLRGAHSAAFGADAMGGAINIVTARGDDASRASARVGGGGQDLREGRASAAGGGLELSGNLLQDGEREDGSRLRVGSASASMTLSPTPAWSTRVSARATDRRSEAFPESSGGVRFARVRALEERDVDQRLLSLDSRFRPETGRDWNLRLSRFERHESVASPGVAPGPGGALPASDSDTELTRDIAALTTAFDGLPLAGVATFGGQWTRERGDAETRIPAFGSVPARYALSRKTRSLFAALQIEPVERLRVAVVARRDDVSSVDRVTTRSAGARWSNADRSTTLRANWSEGFKPPSFFALGNALVGNPDLRPEESRTVEAGIDQRLGMNALLQATAFRNRFTDLIDFDAASFRLVNRHRVTTRGVELGLQWSPHPDWTFDATYTRTDFRTDADTPLRNRPKHRGSLSATFRLADTQTLHARLIHVGRTRDFSVPTGETRLDPWQRLDLAYRYRVGANLTLEAAIDNALDKRHESFAGFRDPGRRLRFALGVAI